MTPEEIEKLQATLESHKQQGGQAPPGEKLPVELIEKIVDRVVVVNNSRQRTMHLKDRESEWNDPLPACMCDSRERGWRSKSVEVLGGGYEWCDWCRSIAKERYRP